MNAYFELQTEEVSIKIRGPEVHIGLGWDPIKGSLSKVVKGIAEEVVVGVSADAYDLNLAAIVKHSDETADELVFFGHKEDKSEKIKYLHDNRTGSGSGEDEGIDIKLSALPASVNEIVLFTLIYDGKNCRQSFGDIENLFVQIKDTEYDKVIYRDEDSFKDAEASKYSVYVFGKFSKDTDDDWTFESMHRFSDENTEADVKDNLK